MKVLVVQDVEVLLDDWDWLRLCGYKWRIKSNGKGQKCLVCVTRQLRKSRTIHMDRDVMKTPDGMECYHKEGNVFDNRKEMLENLTKDECAKRILKRI